MEAKAKTKSRSFAALQDDNALWVTTPESVGVFVLNGLVAGVVGVAGEDGEGAVELLGEDYAG